MGDYAAAAVAVQLSLSADGSIEQVGIGLTNVAALPLELLMLKMPCEVSHLMRICAGRTACRGCTSPADDLRGSAEYKLTLIRELIQRALRRSVERAQEELIHAKHNITIEINGESVTQEVDSRKLLIIFSR